MLNRNTVAAMFATLVLAAPLQAQSELGPANVPAPQSALQALPADPVLVAPTVTLAEPDVVTPVSATPATRAVSFAPTRENASAGLHRLAPAAGTELDAPKADYNGRSTSMMIVGGAALVVGAVIGGDAGTLIMIGGAAIGLYGLWQYLQ